MNKKHELWQSVHLSFVIHSFVPHPIHCSTNNTYYCRKDVASTIYARRTWVNWTNRDVICCIQRKNSMEKVMGIDLVHYILTMAAIHRFDIYVIFGICVLRHHIKIKNPFHLSFDETVGHWLRCEHWARETWQTISTIFNFPVINHARLCCTPFPLPTSPVPSDTFFYFYSFDTANAYAMRSLQCSTINLAVSLVLPLSIHRCGARVAAGVLYNRVGLYGRCHAMTKLDDARIAGIQLTTHDCVYLQTKLHYFTIFPTFIAPSISFCFSPNQWMYARTSVGGLFHFYSIRNSWHIWYISVPVVGTHSRHLLLLGSRKKKRPRDRRRRGKSEIFACQHQLNKLVHIVRVLAYITVWNENMRHRRRWLVGCDDAKRSAYARLRSRSDILIDERTSTRRW